MSKPILNIGILAHVDAGKTTVTEQMLFAAGAVRQAGSVDQGTSATDHLAVERERGISVRLATASFDWQDMDGRDWQVNIIDTPGHVDFSSEVERSLLALDAAVLVVSAVEGVQGQTLTVFHALREMQIPTIVFINKIDRMGADVDAVVEEIEKEFGVQCFQLQSIDDVGGTEVSLNYTWSEQIILESQIEQVIEHDEVLLEQFLEGETIGFNQLDGALKSATLNGDLVPVLCGAGKLSLGIEPLMDAVVRYLPVEIKHINELSAVVFKIEHDKTLGRMAYIRVFSGQIKPREVLTTECDGEAFEQKVSQIKQVVQGKYQSVELITAGDIGVVSGLTEAQVGDVFGDASLVPNVTGFSAPLLTVQVKADKDAQFPQLAQALQQLSAEDPMLDLEWLSDIRELHIKIAGKIQIEILQAQLIDRYGLQATFEDPTIIYKETPIKTALGYERYWMPKPCWAIMEVELKPGKLGSGVSFESKVSNNDVAAKYQKEIEATLPKALKQGIKGWQVTDVAITLVAGEDHNVHSRSGDFAIATPMAIMNGLKISDTQLLEPILAVKISAPLDLLGTISSDITKMRGIFDSPEIEGERFIITAQIPAATSIDYPIQLASKSGGKAKFTSRLLNYQPCDLAQGQTREYRGVSPLDRDKWILQVRGAL